MKIVFLKKSELQCQATSKLIAVFGPPTISRSQNDMCQRYETQNEFVFSDLGQVRRAKRIAIKNQIVGKTFEIFPATDKYIFFSLSGKTKKGSHFPKLSEKKTSCFGYVLFLVKYSTHPNILSSFEMNPVFWF